MKKLNLFNRSGMSPDGTSRKGRYCLDSIVSRFSLGSLICVLMLTLGVGNAWGVVNGDVFTRISSVSDLSAGDEIIFVNQAETYACNTTQNSNNRSASTITITNHSYTYNSSHGIQVFVVKTYNGNYGFHTGSGYLYSASGSNNYLRTNSTSASTNPSGTAAWALSVSNYVFSITNASNTSYYMAFNGNTIFSQYKSSMTKPYIYKKVAASTYTVTYNGNGNTSGSVPTDATEYSSGATVTVKGNTGSLAKTGWTFAGWNKNNTGTSTNYTAGSGTFSITANTTLYAKWTCTVTWSVNGQTNVYSQQTITYNPSGSKVSSVPTPNPASYCGQVFAGWTTEEYSGNSAPSVLFKTVGDSPNLNSTGSITFYAVFADYAD